MRSWEVSLMSRHRIGAVIEADGAARSWTRFSLCRPSFAPRPRCRLAERAACPDQGDHSRRLRVCLGRLAEWLAQGARAAAFVGYERQGGACEGCGQDMKTRCGK